MTINDKSHGSVAPCLRYGGSVDYYFITNVMLVFFQEPQKSINIWQSYEQEN